MGNVDVLIGLQWGDEGKGKQIDSLIPDYDSVARFQGGPNARHCYEFNGVKIIGHQMPSGALHKHVDLIIGNGVVVNPSSLIKEFLDLKDKGIDVSKRLYISERAKLITYLHPFMDAAEECRMGKKSVGSTLTGIGPSYRDFKARQILLVGDILRCKFCALLEDFLNFQMKTLKMYEKEYGYIIPKEEIDTKQLEWFSALNEMELFNICDVSDLIRKKIENGKKILAEGAQGVMLDNDFGDYPYVTSSNTLTANVCLGLGIPHQYIGEVYGVIKVYTTKVGGGFFPSKIKDSKVENDFRVAGNEYGATTGRPRMCGWLDLVQLKLAIYLSGTTSLFINKADICPTDRIQLVVNYLDGDHRIIEKFPLHLEEEICDTETYEFLGWGDKASGLMKDDDLPEELISYIKFIENELNPLNVKIMSLGTGPKREQSVRW